MLIISPERRVLGNGIEAETADALIVKQLDLMTVGLRKLGDQLSSESLFSDQMYVPRLSLGRCKPNRPGPVEQRRSLYVDRIY